MKMTELTQGDLASLPCLHEGRNYCLHLQTGPGQERTLVIKSLQADAEEKSGERLVNEYLQTVGLHLPGIRQPRGQLLVGGRPALALEYVEGETLRESHIRQQRTLTENLELAIALSAALETLHQRHLIHRNLASEHIIVSSAPMRVTLIGFGDALIEDRQGSAAENDLSSSMLAYISPEQTGRTNRRVDHRADLYSLGAVFYEMFTGKPPFDAAEPAELIYSHLARNPPPPQALHTGLPRVVSDLILRLLAKNPDERYQSAYGVRADLTDIRQQLQQAGRIGDITLGLADYSSSFRLPERIYDREEELESLRTALNGALGGSGSLVLVSGRAGSGKTALVEALRPSAVQQDAYFIVGPYESSQRHVPYAGLRQAFEAWIDLILTESAEQLTAWKNQLLTAVGDSADLLLDLLPRLKLIIGPQASVSEAAPALTHHRFHHLLGAFVFASATKDHPLVLFLDNLQWADQATLELLSQLLPGIGSRPMVLVLAYRDDEVGANHPLTGLLDALTTEDVNRYSLHLDSLSKEIINLLIAETLKSDPAETLPLTQLVLEKTGGNPLFIRQFMQSLHDNGQLEFEADRRCWSWNTEGVRQQVIISSVAEMMAQKIRRQPEASRSILAMAACFGSRFRSRALATLVQLNETELAEQLQPAIEAGLLQITQPSQTSVGESGKDSETLFEFTHDRVHQAAYGLLALKQRRLIHLRIGRLLLDETPADLLEDRVFEITDQFNHSFQYLEDEQELRRLISLNLMAGRKARREAAYQAAIRYLSMGIGLLPSNRWEDPEEPVLELFLEAIEAEYQSANFERGALLSNELLQHTGDIFIRLRVYELSILSLTAQNRNQSAIEAGMSALEELGIELTESIPKAERQQLATLLGRIEALARLPAMNNSRHLASLRIMMHMATPAQRSNPQLLQALIGKMVLQSSTHGNSPMAAFAYGWYGALLCGTSGEIEAGYRFGRLSLEVLRQYPLAEIKIRTKLLFNAYVRHWKEPVQKSIKQLQKAYQQGLESGNPEYTSLGAVHFCGYLLFTGEPLEAVRHRVVDYQQSIVRWRLPFQGEMLSIWLRTTTLLRGGKVNSINLQGELFDESQYLSAQASEENSLFRFSLSCCRTMLQYLFGNYAAAVESGEETETYSQSALGLYYWAIHSYHYALALLALHETAEPRKRADYLELAAPLIDRLHRWAALSPSNFAHHLALVEAEQAHALGDNGRAMEGYNLAGHLARENGRPMDEAMVYEREALFYAAQGRDDIAGLVLRKAVDCYRSWGALSKVEELEHRFKTLVRQEPTLLDTTAILKASHMLSQEVHLEQLLEKMMRIVIENAGAEKGLLIQSSADGLIIQARGDSGGVETMQSQPLKTSGEAALSVINYVIRTQSQVVLGDAQRDPVFGNDDYIATHLTRSLLCLPIVYQGKISGLLYLENNLTSDVFTIDRLELLKALASQAAISIENATLYAELESNIAALRESEQKFRLIFDQTFQFIGVLDTEGRVLQANRTALQFIGVEEEAVIGKPFWETPWWAHSVELQQRLKEAVEEATQGRLVRFEATHPAPDGRVSHVDFSLKPVTDVNGKVTQLIPEGRDITERKEAEEELMRYKEHLEETVLQRTEELRLARDEAEAANRAKSFFLANMSHELRTPLNAILGFSHLMQRDETLSKEQHETLNIINTSGEHLLKLINDVLEIAKIEAGKLQLAIAPFDLHVLVRDVAVMMRIRAQQKGLELELDQAPEVPRYIQGDEARLRQILVNLVSNAVKFTDEGDVTINIAVKDNARRQLLLEVADKGPGISETDQKRLFKPFEQLPEGKMRVGTGLGLSIVQHFVKMMGGTIAVESRLGEGTLFRVEVPLKEADEAQLMRLDEQLQGEVISLAPGESSRRILVVEDQKENQLLLAKLMADIGMEVKVADNGEECLEIFKRWKPDLIWMDRRMPVMDGVETTLQIRRMPGGKKVKIVAVTASAFKEQEPELLGAGMDGYIRKPFLFNEIYDCLTHQLGIKFTYRTEAKAAKGAKKTLTPQLILALSAKQREELRIAVESLDNESINAAIARIAVNDAELGQVLTHLASEFDYPTILSAIEAASQEE